MRVLQFVTLFLALAVVTGCSHRRARQAPVTTSLCECSACRCDQERMVREGAIPAEHFANFDAHQASPPVETVAPLVAPPKTNDFAPEYAIEPDGAANTLSPYSSGNPIEMDSEAPGTFGLPAIDQIETDSQQFSPSNSATEGQLDLPSSNQITPIDDVPSETIPDGAFKPFKPFNRDVFKVKSKIDDAIPVQDQPSILIDKVTESRQPDLSLFVPAKNLRLQLPQADEPEANDFKVPDLTSPNALSLEPLSLEQEQTETPAPVEAVAEAFQPYLSQAEPAAETVSETVLPAPNKTVPIAQTIAQPIRQTDTVVEGQLYEDPIVLYARQRRDLLTASAVQNPGAVKPASVQKPVEHQSIVQNSEYDPVYGLPLTNNVDFDSLPIIEPPRIAPQPVAPPQVAPSSQAQHLHVHIHHDYSDAPTGPVRRIEQAGHQAVNAQVVYRDDEGRVIMAPPTPTGGINSAEPTGDRRTYYVPPEQILRLKATSPISRQRSHPSVATIQMRDTIIHGGTHLLATPEYQARPVLTNHGLPGINHEKLREAFNVSPTDNPLR